ncbi:alkaline phosphatase [Alkalihalobacillus alcalophilus ATCC 27647 = CGMCC 1.3604]|uniref:Alkaline phosphatase n=1 Tax=Alkalihalobacillus alcalophilus ATCC 27647 = CGMCC 1.3604 TaxID=1218173 RepID=A0A094XH98_ALKAL|nr:DedA family protein [Alkalihalobacillus alcalophilus]KGA98160.1 alkaline phosphatase [Alkalihalobacillus alcalophilus ATCC 27647 = CGMCC 1.3604]MED1560846.1 DedA family protein [Alkalihalobacillus alcalophilus]THG90533.1 alkaline phosphatase [Alkalihalobacillus alcalophilus ATCC 27647 = CGMCC 1.3604]
MENWIISVMEQLGYIGIMVLIALENLFPPIPSEVILTFGGFMTTQSDMTLIAVIFFATVGSTLGAIILYSIGSLLGVQRMEKLVDKYGHIIRLTKIDLYRSYDWFERYGPWAVFLCRLLPLIRSLISIPAGMAKMNLSLFILLSAFGSLIWNTIIVNIGAQVGESWDSVLIYMNAYSKIVYTVLASLIVFSLILFIRRRFLIR